MASSDTKSYRFGRFVLDARSGCLRCDGMLVPLRAKSFDLLHYLVRNSGRLVPKGELIDKVWPGVNVTENSLVQCVKDIRHALDDAAQTIVQNVAKRGYLFAPAVVEVDPEYLDFGEHQAQYAAVVQVELSCDGERSVLQISWFPGRLAPVDCRHCRRGCVSARRCGWSLVDIASHGHAAAGEADFAPRQYRSNDALIDCRSAI